MIVLMAKAAARRSSVNNDLAFVVGQKTTNNGGNSGTSSTSAVLTSKSWRPIYAARMTAKNQLSNLLALPSHVRRGPTSFGVRKTAVVTSSAPIKNVEIVKRAKSYSPEKEIFMATLLP